MVVEEEVVGLTMIYRQGWIVYGGSDELLRNEANESTKRRSAIEVTLLSGKAFCRVNVGLHHSPPPHHHQYAVNICGQVM